MKITCLYRHTAVDASDRCKETGGEKTRRAEFCHCSKGAECEKDTEGTLCRGRNILQRGHEQPSDRKALSAQRRVPQPS